MLRAVRLARRVDERRERVDQCREVLAGEIDLVARPAQAETTVSAPSEPSMSSRTLTTVFVTIGPSRSLYARRASFARPRCGRSERIRMRRISGSASARINARTSKITRNPHSCQEFGMRRTTGVLILTSFGGRRVLGRLRSTPRPTSPYSLRDDCQQSLTPCSA